MKNEVINSNILNSLTPEERSALDKISSKELYCDWCGIPLEARIIPDENNTKRKTVQLFCKSCCRIYSFSSSEKKS